MLQKLLDSYRIILGSASPRRKQLLQEIIPHFSIQPQEIDESFPSHLPAAHVAAYIAHNKAQNYLSRLQENEILITADTIVVVGNEILAKPENEQHAFEMIEKLSGNSHEVITGVCICSKQKNITFSDHTIVHFNSLTADEIWYYIRNYRPFDKAGSYGAQDWIGMVGISKLEGSYFNVMGLPIDKVYQHLKNF